MFIILLFLFMCFFFFFFFKQKTAYEMRISDWSSDVCSSDLVLFAKQRQRRRRTSCYGQRCLCFARSVHCRTFTSRLCNLDCRSADHACPSSTHSFKPTSPLRGACLATPGAVYLRA